MPRYYRRRYYGGYRAKRLRYSNETMTTTSTFNTGSTPSTDITASGNFGVLPPLEIVAPAVTQGIRKVKNISLSIAPIITNASGDQLSMPVRYALVYVPEGTNPSSLQTGAGVNSLYEPNQNVIMQGSFLSGQPYRSWTRLARNLNSGDSIFLIMVANSGSAWGTNSATFGVNMNYAIAYA